MIDEICFADISKIGLFIEENGLSIEKITKLIVVLIDKITDNLNRLFKAFDKVKNFEEKLNVLENKIKAHETLHLVILTTKKKSYK
jgi:hypothetical protein